MDRKKTLPGATMQEVDKEILPGSTVPMGTTWRKTNLDENWVVHTKEVRENDFVEYEVFSILDCPTDEQLSKLDYEA